MDTKPIVYRGSREICSAVGVNYKEIVYYVNELELPAFKINGKSQWLAVHEDLDRWIKKQRDIHLK